MKKSICILFSLVFPFVLLGQTSLVGKVVDKKTGVSLPGVNIIIESLKIGTTTNSNGEYQLDGIKHGKYKVTASFIGYTEKKKIFSFHTNNILNFSLIQKTESLNEIYVLAKTKARKMRELAMPISVISMDQLSGTVNSVSDVLNKTVGISVRSSGGVGSSSRVSVRGLEGKRIGFFIDEIPLSEHSDVLDINDLPVDVIDRIEIYKGVVPAKFGGSAIGGAVNIVTKEYPPKYLDFSYGIESFNTHKASIVAKRNNKEKGIELGIGGFYTYSDNNYKMKLPLENGIKVSRDHDRYEKITMAGGISFKRWWFDEVKFEPVFIKTDKEIQGIEQNIQYAKNRSIAYIFANHIEKKNFIFEGLDFDLQTAYTYTTFEFIDKAMRRYRWDGSSYKTISSLGGEIGRYPSDSYDVQYIYMNKLNLNFVIDENHSFNYNCLYKYMNGKPKNLLKDKALGFKTSFDSEMISWVTGLSYEYKSNDERFLNSFTGKYYSYSIESKKADTWGIKNLENIHINKTNWGLNNALRYKITPDFIVKTSGAYEMRLPSESELLGDGFFINPANDLKPERSTSFNMGFMLDKNGNKNSKFQMEINVFYMHLKNMIKLSGGALQSHYRNFGEMNTKGIEFEVKTDVLPFLYAYANTTYQDSRDVRKYEEGSNIIVNPNKGKRIPNIPYFFINYGVEYHKENLFGGDKQNTRLFVDNSL